MTTSDTGIVRRTIVWRPKPSVGGRLGWGIAASLGLAAAAGLFVGVLVGPGVIALLFLSLGFCSLLAAAVIALWAFGFTRLRYVLTPGALVVRWLGREEVVPLLQLEGVYSGKRIQSIPRLRGLSWPGYWVGRGAFSGGELVCYATSTVPSDLTLLVTAQESFVLSPEDVTGFRDELIRRAEAELDEVPAGRSSRLASAAVALLDGLNQWLLALGLVLALLVLSHYMLGIASMPDRAVLHFGSDGSPDVVGPRNELIVLPLVALGGWLVSAIAGLLLIGQEQGAARLIWLGNAVAGCVMLVATLRLIP